MTGSPVAADEGAETAAPPGRSRCRRCCAAGLALLGVALCALWSQSGGGSRLLSAPRVEGRALTLGSAPLPSAVAIPRATGCAAHRDLPAGEAASLSGEVAPACYALGELVLHWRPGGARGLALSHRDDPEHPLWSSRADEAFLRAGRGVATVLGADTAGFFQLRDALEWETSGQTVESLEVAGDGVELRGQLVGGPRPVPYTLRFRAAGARQAAFSVELSGEANRVSFAGASVASERFLGFGEQFSRLDFKGQRLPILVREQGIGRGKQPLTGLLNAAMGAGGGWDFSYAAFPLALTDRRRGLVLEDSDYCEFDLREDERFEVRLFSDVMHGRLFYGPRLLDLIREATEVTGRMQPLPDWMHSGAIVGMTGGEREVLDMQAKLQEHGVPVAGWFLQDWVGERHTPFGIRLWWNWEPDPATYPDWRGLVRQLNAAGGKVFAYVNPFLVDASERGPLERNLYREAEREGYLVRRQDGSLYAFPQGGYSAGLVDLSNPAAYAWLKAVIKEQVLATGVSGWMGDFGESLPFDAKLHSGDARSFHNRYPEVWQRLQREAVAEAGRSGEVVFFSRSGFTRSPGLTTLFWAGDQLTTWDRHDGLESSIVGLINSGLSGMSLNHSDIGGYTTIGVGPVVAVERSRELMLRWMELNAFTPVYRTHEGLHPNAGHQLDADAGTLEHFARMGKVFQALLPYRKRLMAEAAAHGWPLVRHPVLVDDDPALFASRTTFMLGSELFVAPVTEPGRAEVRALLPKGRWVSVWSDAVFGDPARAQEVTLPAPTGQPAVLAREGSPEGERFVAELKRLGLR